MPTAAKPPGSIPQPGQKIGEVRDGALLMDKVLFDYLKSLEDAVRTLVREAT